MRLVPDPSWARGLRDALTGAADDMMSGTEGDRGQTPPEMLEREAILAEAVLDEPEVLGGKNGSLRRCIVSGTVQRKDRMVRFVVGPDNQVVPDLEETLPGRGLWLTAEAELVEKAVTKNAFSRAARRKVEVAPDLKDRLAALMRRRLLDLIGLVSRGGGAVAGFEKAHAALKGGRVAKSGAPGVWLEARDGAADGRRKLAPIAGARGLAPIDLFDRGELGRALGRDEAVHVVLADGPLAGRLRRDVKRLTLLTGAVPPGDTAGVPPDATTGVPPDEISTA